MGATGVLTAPVAGLLGRAACALAGPAGAGLLWVNPSGQGGRGMPAQAVSMAAQAIADKRITRLCWRGCLALGDGMEKTDTVDAGEWDCSVIKRAFLAPLSVEADGVRK